MILDIDVRVDVVHRCGVRIVAETGELRRGRYRRERRGRQSIRRLFRVQVENPDMGIAAPQIDGIMVDVLERTLGLGL